MSKPTLLKILSGNTPNLYQYNFNATWISLRHSPRTNSLRVPIRLRAAGSWGLPGQLANRLLHLPRREAVSVPR
jgi:hypothetical protein